MRTYRLSTHSAIIIGLAITAAVVLWFGTGALPLSQAFLMICPGLAFTGMLLLGSDAILKNAQNRIKARPLTIALVPAGLWALYTIYATGMGIANSRALVTMAVYLSVPFLVFAVWPKAEPLMILWIWLPLELGIVRQILITHTPGADLHYAFAQLLAIDAGIVAFIIWNRTPGVGYRFEFHRTYLRAGLANFLMFAVIAIPMGFAIHFIHYSFTMQKLYRAVPVFIGIFLFTALPEEFLFRGLIQNWIQRVSRSRVISLLIASLIFGASHLNNGPPVPNYRYFLMATVAGIFYGSAWSSTGSLMASSLTHALVDTVWSVVFR
ncbi:MAG TPA: type II CAAX endopeptidase family protein [Terriglobia bacterium]|nr:type II CAAX endopeptidase family protein [Terriglobia bacterium]